MLPFPPSVEEAIGEIHKFHYLRALNAFTHLHEPFGSALPTPLRVLPCVGSRFWAPFMLLAHILYVQGSDADVNLFT